MRKTTITILSLITLAGCGRKGARSSDFDSATSAALATGAAAAQMASIPKTAHLSAVELGHQLDRHDMIFGGVATQYKAADSVLVSAKGLYVVAGSVVSARIRLKNATLDSTSAKIGAAVSFGAALLGAFMGKKMMSATNISKAGTVMRSVGRVTQESSDVGRAEENAGAIHQQYADLDAQFKQDCDAIDATSDPMTDELDKVTLKPKKTNITVRMLALCWAPHAMDAGGNATPAW